MRRNENVTLWSALTFLGLASMTIAAEPLKIITERDVAVPIRDGVVLRANVFRPDRGGLYHVLVLRTPYGKPSGGMDRYVKAGYIVVTQDARGRYASDGKWESFLRFETHYADVRVSVAPTDHAARRATGSRNALIVPLKQGNSPRRTLRRGSEASAVRLNRGNHAEHIEVP